MSEVNFSYYQFQKDLGYEVYLRFEDFEFENQFSETLEVMGFQKVERDKIKSLAFKQNQTRVLRVIKATPRISRQIGRSDFVFDKYGPESFSQMGSYDVYRYKNVGMMVVGNQNFLWELGVKSTKDQNAIRTILTRYLSFAMAPMGVVGFWGVPIEEGFVVMSPRAANFESVFVDLNKQVLITYDGVKYIEADLQILRLDTTLRDEMKGMKKEQLLSFLSMNTSHISYTGMDTAISSTIWELSQVASGYIYPESNFKPRMNINEA